MFLKDIGTSEISEAVKSRPRVGSPLCIVIAGTLTRH